ncbi:PASTA domain-containing protein [Streptomyces sp. NPDC001744]|uniref:PASTA domain-containing protein n=1 Tax=Streptomyces sp. NPDC001744 TaxID=3364606 RepID=UPI0036970B29
MDPYSSVAPPPPSAPPAPRRWWQHPVLVVGALVVLPPVGIALAWLSPWNRKGKIAATVAAVVWFAFLLFSDPSEEPGEAGGAKGGGRPGDGAASASTPASPSASTGIPSPAATPAGPPRLVGKVLKEARRVADGAGYDVVTHDASDRDDGQWDAGGWKVCFQTAAGQRGGGRPVLDLGVVRVGAPCPSADGEEIPWPAMPDVAGGTFARAGETLKAAGVGRVRPESVYTDVTLPADPAGWKVCFQDPGPGKELENPQYVTAYLKLAPPDAACPDEPYARLRPEPTP